MQFDTAKQGAEHFIGHKLLQDLESGSVTGDKMSVQPVLSYLEGLFHTIGNMPASDISEAAQTEARTVDLDLCMLIAFLKEGDDDEEES